MAIVAIPHFLRESVTSPPRLPRLCGPNPPTPPPRSRGTDQLLVCRPLRLAAGAPVVGQPGGEVGGGDRAAQVVALDVGAAHLPQKPPDPLVLDALGDHVEPQVAAEVDDRSDDRLVVGAV